MHRGCRSNPICEQVTSNPSDNPVREGSPTILPELGTSLHANTFLAREALLRYGGIQCWRPKPESQRWQVGSGTISSFGMARENAGLFAGPVGSPFAAAWAGIGGHMWCGEGFSIGMT